MNDRSSRAAVVGRFLATAGATLLALVMSATSVIALLWALTTLLGLPEIVLWILFIPGAVPVLWATLWIAGRAWHVEQLLEQGRDTDQPDFRLGAYLRKK